MIKLVWKVRLTTSDTSYNCVWETKQEALLDYESIKPSDGEYTIKLYPVIMTTKKFNSLKEFEGF